MSDKLAKELEKQGVTHASRHVFVCVGDECASKDETKAAYKQLRKRMKAVGLTKRDVHVTKVDCLGPCTGGPLAVVYPEGSWYGDCGGEVTDRLVDEHLVQGRPVADQVVATTGSERGA